MIEIKIKFEDLVNKYNVILADKGKGYRLRYESEVIMGDEIIDFRIVLANSNGLKYDGDIYLADKDMDELIMWFANKGVNLACNNTGQTFWETSRE